MLKYLLKEITDNSKVYIFYPEGDESCPGSVCFHSDGTVEVLEDSAKDVKRYYAGHACCGIDQTKESGIVAWC